MRWLTLLSILGSALLGSAQVQSGTVLYADFSQNQLVIAADSRTTGSGGDHFDTECKIHAFGRRFVFAMDGVVKSLNQWDAQSVAREAWKRESQLTSDPETLISRVPDDWVTEMEKLYADRDAISQSQRLIAGTPVLANAIFATVDKVGKVKVRVLDVSYAIDLTGKILMNHDSYFAPDGATLLGGHSEVIKEFLGGSSPRAVDYMRWFRARIATEDSNMQRADLASKFVELSILLNPHNETLAFPIDVVRLTGAEGVHWVWRKENCLAVPRV
jgi:hypothetical protein